jgi:hypothetical protein
VLTSPAEEQELDPEQPGLVQPEFTVAEAAEEAEEAED